MNILFLSHRLPYPPNDGSRIRAFRIIRHLAGRGKVTVATLARSASERARGEGLQAFCARLIIESISPAMASLRTVACLAGTAPSSMGYFRSPALQRRIDHELKARAYDLVVVHSSSVAPYVENVNTAKLLDFVDMDSQKWLAYGKARPFPLSLGYRLEGAKLERAEAALAARYDVCTCITPAELATLQSFGTARTSGWFPNGVDLEYFRPADDDGASCDTDLMCFVGRMDYYPNVRAMIDFCKGPLPIIRRHRPNVRLRIVGADPGRAIRKLARLPGVEVSGTVPDVRPYVRRAAVSIAPLGIARGMQNKILEAMAMGIPVIASRLAAGGVDARPGQDLLVADGPEPVAEAVLRLMTSPAEWRRLSHSGRRRVEQHYHWEQAMSRFDTFVDLCLASRSTAATPAGVSA